MPVDATRQQPEAGMEDTVAFVQHWLLSTDHEPTRFDRDFAAAIDARCAATRLAVPARVGREEVAREVDPEAFEPTDNFDRKVSRDMRRAEAYSAADRILSVLDHAATDQVSGSEIADRPQYAEASRVEERGHIAEAGGVEVPSGWKLVPVKATAQMEQAGSGFIFEDGINYEARCDAATHVWTAMLTASPAARNCSEIDSRLQPRDSGRRGDERLAEQSPQNKGGEA